MLEAAELAARVGMFRVSPQGDPCRFEVRWAYALPTPAGLRSKGTPSAGPHHWVVPVWARRRSAGGSWRPLA